MFVRVDFSDDRSKENVIRVGDRPTDEVHAKLGPTLPFKSGAIDQIFLGRSLAYVDDLVATMEELWRICKPGAYLHLRLPHASCQWSATKDPKHPHSYTLSTLDYFMRRHKPRESQSTALFDVERTWLYHRGPRPKAHRATFFGNIAAGLIESVANAHRGWQYRFERYLAPLVGGFEELSATMSAAKPIPGRYDPSKTVFDEDEGD